MNMTDMRLKWLFICFFIAYFPLFSLHGQPDSLVLNELLVQGDSLLHIAHYESARKTFKKVLKINGKSIEALAGLGKVAVKNEEWGEAKDWFQNHFILPSKIQIVVKKS